MTDTVYLITQGSYSDYHVIAAAASREEAERVAERIRAAQPNSYDQPEVEEYPMVTADDIHLWSSVFLMALIDRHGELLDEREHTSRGWDFEPYERKLEVNYWPPVIVRGQRRQGKLYVTGPADDEERVRKVYSEKLAELRTDEALRLGGAR